MGGISGEAEALVAASPEACLAVLTDFQRYPEWYEMVDEATIVERAADGSTTVDALTRVAVRTLRYRMRYESRPDGLRAHMVSGDFNELELDWRLTPDGEGTHVRLRLSGSVGWALDRLLSPVRDAVRRELVDDAVSGLKARAES